MAARVFYGTCSTAANASEKHVVLKDSTINPETNFQFQIGDLISVSFLNKNTASNPSLVIHNGDPNLNSSIIDDGGKLIKTRGAEVNGEGLWDDGETIIFCYVHDYTNSDEAIDENEIGETNIYYWVAQDSAYASGDVYGITKISYADDQDIASWLLQDTEEDYNSALAPAMLKKFYRALVKPTSSSEEETPGGEPVPQLFENLGIFWTTDENVGEPITLGYLSLYDSENAEKTPITYPLEAKILQIINENRQTVDIPTKTSDLANDGPDPLNVGNSSEDGHFYLTNVIPNGKSLNVQGDNELIPFLTPDQSGNVGIPNNLSVGTLEVNGATTIGGATTISNTLTVTGTTTLKATTVNGVLNGVGNTIKTTGYLQGGTIYEGGKSLISKYQTKLYTKRVPAHITVAANDSTGHRYINICKTSDNVVPLGIVGYNLDEAEEKYVPSKAHLWEFFLVERNGYHQVEYAIRNYTNSKQVYDVYFWILMGAKQ